MGWPACVSDGVGLGALMSEQQDERAAEQAGDWVREDFDPWSELTKERDGARADAEADRRRQDLWGY